jgi:regulator of sigma E protease
MTILSTLVVLSILILVHELGHFWAAKSVDIEVRRFSLGMGPRVAGFRRGETEFVLAALPIGGYVSMAGMEDDETAVLEGGAAPREASPRDFDSKPLWARAWVVSAGVLMNFLFAFLVFALLGVVYGERINPLDRIAAPVPEQLAPGAAELLRVPEGSRVVTVAGRPVANWSEVVEALQGAPAGPVQMTFADAPPVTLQMPAADSARIALIGGILPVTPPVIGYMEPGRPAAQGGLRPGDVIVAVGGEAVGSWQQFVRLVRGSPDTPLRLQVERGGERLALTLTPTVENERTPGGQEIAVGRIGALPQPPVAYRPLGVGAAVVRGAEQTWGISATIVRFVGSLLSGGESPRSVGSILTVGELSGQTARMGAESFLGFLAMFSLNLAILNLLPIPVLDGGHLLFMGIEAVRGRPLSVEQRMRLSQVGLFVIVGIMVWAMTNDVLRAFGI